MYEIYETENRIPSYYTVLELYNRSSDKRLNLQFKIYDNLQHSRFDGMARGNKSIVYDQTHLTLEEFQLEDLSDEDLWSIMTIVWQTLKKRYHRYTYLILDETFEEIQKYLEKKKISYKRLEKYGITSDNKLEGPAAYLNWSARF